jgi:hypothetical protein
MNSISESIEFYSNTFKVALQFFISGCNIGRRDINGVRIQMIHYLVDSIILQRIQSNLIDIFVPDQVQRFLQRGSFISFEETLTSCILVKLETEKHSGYHYQGEDQGQPNL